MEGWLSNIPFIASIFFFSSLIVAFFYHWWTRILIFFVATFLGVLVKLFWGRSVSYYLSLLYHKMAHRAANYKRDNDVTRSDAAESYCKDPEELMVTYHGTGLGCSRGKGCGLTVPKIPGVNHFDAVRAFEKAGSRIIRHGKHIVRSDGIHVIIRKTWMLDTIFPARLTPPLDLSVWRGDREI